MVEIGILSLKFFSKAGLERMSATGRVAAAAGSALYMGDGKDSVGSAYSNSSVCISLSIFSV